MLFPDVGNPTPKMEALHHTRIVALVEGLDDMFCRVLESLGGGEKKELRMHLNTSVGLHFLHRTQVFSRLSVHGFTKLCNT